MSSILILSVQYMYPSHWNNHFVYRFENYIWLIWPLIKRTLAFLSSNQCTVQWLRWYIILFNLELMFHLSPNRGRDGSFIPRCNIFELETKVTYNATKIIPDEVYVIRWNYQFMMMVKLNFNDLWNAPIEFSLLKQRPTIHDITYIL